MRKHKKNIVYFTVLIVVGIAVNIFGAKLTDISGLPVFLDTIGTVFVAALGGALPGVAVGFFSNILNSIDDPVSMYYGIISISIAFVAAYMSKRGVFRKLYKALYASLIFAVLGGGVGSLITWMLYGFNFGMSVSAPYARSLNSMGLSKFASQFIADMGVDILDKIITVAVVIIMIKLLPECILNKYPIGSVYIGKVPKHIVKSGNKRYYRKLSLKSKLVFLIVVIVFIIGTLSISISCVIYKNTMTDKYIGISESTVDMMISVINPDSIDTYLDSKIENDEYKETEESFKKIRECMANIEYMYVYKIESDGCHVVFDVDTGELEGEQLGTVIEYDDAFLPYINELLAGKEIDPIISNGKYGWLLSVYKPIIDSQGECVAYAASDVNMESVIRDRYVFMIKIATILIAASILIIAYTLWYSENSVVDPLIKMADETEKFAFQDGAQRLDSVDRIKSLNICTGDELEKLYNSLTKTVTDMGLYITDINKKASFIQSMQDNVIMSFAELVENRDKSTGKHIKNTAMYVSIILNEMKSEGVYSDILTDDYIHDVIKSAPLHDIGKIRISDVILNKPGKLTAEEFDIMKTHTTAGREILRTTIRNIDTMYLAHAMEMAEFHHEKWNGRGYPKGLSGQQIPLSARVMSVADVFDALVSKRCYKSPLPFDTAVSIIKQESGESFDPAVVNAFINSLDKIMDALKN